MADQRDPQTYAIIGAAMEVHGVLGPGFLERVYQDALEIEFCERAIPYERERNCPIGYKSHTLPSLYRADFICFDQVILETKAQSVLTAIDEAQTFNYLKATSFRVALLVNFGTPSLEFKRFIH